MSPPVPREPRGRGRWDAIISASDSWPRAFRFCLIWFVMVMAPVAATVITLLMEHVL